MHDAAVPDETVDSLVARARSGDRRSLARAITAVENGSDDAPALLAAFNQHVSGSRRIGITGPPGAGKSTLVSGLISQIVGDGLTVAVIAVDPSSPFTGGSILGDRIRMQDHVENPGVYIRSMASRGQLGGMASAVPQVAMLLDGAGFDVLLIETVGVGQAEVDIVGEADSTVVVVNPGWGDSVQANKAGLLEIGDIFVVNKADRDGAKRAVADLEAMLDLGMSRPWRPPVIQTVATEGSGLDELWASMRRHFQHMESGELWDRRERRLGATLEKAVRIEINSRLTTGELGDFEQILERVRNSEIDPWAASALVVAQLDS